ncbi:GAF domain-containing protein [Solirubrobacter ginsenosidimutans]|uniref:histidine kinase n=1 Tax=Solirubrobacter ginsenosidimutans TaxID=490573 RepID=A0A9X3MZM1_9ACTN|nr:GAF domain-containing protein [Solirubrobacter ginsenosidimutans]MDA0165700.1 GAF domain-containing protein [Solirubrobacter ginsenosidimutans]
MAGGRPGDGSELHQLAEQQTALRRVATLVARGAAAETLFAVVAEQVAEILHVPLVSIVRYEADGTATERASFSQRGTLFRLGTRWSLGGTNVVAQVRDSLRPARIDDYAGLTGEIADRVREAGIRSTAGSPIAVAGRLWGAMVVSTFEPDVLPAGIGADLTEFTELVATAIANSEAREELQRLADEQASLRRVATIVAREASQTRAFTAIAEEVGHLLATEEIRMFRFESRHTAIVMAAWGEREDVLPIGARHPLGGENAASRVFATGRPVRIDDYGTATGAIGDAARTTGTRCVVAAPILVQGRLWGAIVAAKRRDVPFPVQTEERLGQFTELMATAIANAEARAELARLVDEQAALRRVATLVAEGPAPTELFDAVTAEMVRALGADGVTLARFESDEELLLVADLGNNTFKVPVGSRIQYREGSVAAIVRRTARPGRVEYDENDMLSKLATRLQARVGVGAPVVVDGRLWGLMVARWGGDETPPPDTEARMERFGQLLETAIANADGRNQLIASRARLVAAADDARRRVVQDLHDGAQQRLVHTIITLKMVERALLHGDDNVESLVHEALTQAEQGIVDLRELAHGILPAALTRGGLRDGVEAVVQRLELPVRLAVADERFDEEIEATAYFLVAEALTNVVKHARAGYAAVSATTQDGMLRLEVSDDGIGGADANGHGLVGMRDRVTALGGWLEIRSPPGAGTLVAATFPLSADVVGHLP